MYCTYTCWHNTNVGNQNKYPSFVLIVVSCVRSPFEVPTILQNDNSRVFYEMCKYGMQIVFLLRNSTNVMFSSFQSYVCRFYVQIIV